MRTSATVGLLGRPLFPGAPFVLSTLTLTVGSARTPADGEAIVSALRRARTRGVTTFDIVDSPDRDLAEALLARAFPEPDPALVVLSPGPDPERRPEPSGPGTFPWARPGFGPSGGPARPGGFRRLLEVDGSHLPRVGSPHRGAGSIAPLGSPGPVAIRCRSAEAVARLSDLPAPRVLSGPLSLLERAAGLAAVRTFGGDGFVWIARDPLAGGRLDGSRFAPAPTGGRGGAPRTVRELEAEFGPIARLGFLARAGQRTLAQAALGYLAQLPWVATVVVPLPTPERWEEVLGFASSLPLDREETSRAEGLSAPAPFPSVGARGRP